MVVFEIVAQQLGSALHTERAETVAHTRMPKSERLGNSISIQKNLIRRYLERRQLRRQKNLTRKLRLRQRRSIERIDQQAILSKDESMGMAKKHRARLAGQVSKNIRHLSGVEAEGMKKLVHQRMLRMKRTNRLERDKDMRIPNLKMTGRQRLDTIMIDLGGTGKMGHRAHNGLISRRRHLTKKRQQLMADLIPSEVQRVVGIVIDIFQLTLLHIIVDSRPRKRQQRSKNGERPDIVSRAKRLNGDRSDAT